MKKLLIVLLMILLLPIAYAVCIEPKDSMEIRENAVFCTGNYNLENGIRIGNDIMVDCNKSSLIGNGIGYGILLKNANNVTVQSCNISNFEVGIYIHNSNNNVIKNNHLVKNKFGIALFNSANNDIDNNYFEDNARQNTINLQSSLTEEEGKEENIVDKPTPQQIMREVIKLKKPLLAEDEILNEVNSILDKYFNFTKENLEITREIYYNETDKSTSITIYLKPKRALLNVSVYEKIPKCVSSYVNKILFRTAGYEVINDDPLILWTFARVEKQEEVSYKVFKEIDEECRNLLAAFGIATGLEEPREKIQYKKSKNSNLNLILLAAAIVLVLAFIYRLKRKENK